MAAKPVKPAALSPLRTKAASIEPGQAFVDPLADVPLLGLATDRFTIQPGEIDLIPVGSIEVLIHPSSEEDETEPMEPPAYQPIERPKNKPSLFHPGRN